MIDEKGQVVLIDFGLGCSKISNRTVTSCRRTDGAGTKVYMSPHRLIRCFYANRIDQLKTCTDSVREDTDIWSLGATLFSVLDNNHSYNQSLTKLKNWRDEGLARALGGKIQADKFINEHMLNDTSKKVSIDRMNFFPVQTSSNKVNQIITSALTLDVGSKRPSAKQLLNMLK